MTPGRVRVRAPSRLHFGLLGWGAQNARQFGGVGLMIEDPSLVIDAEPAPAWHAEGPMADRVLRVAETVAVAMRSGGVEAGPARFRVVGGPAEHVGLGSGTQLGLAVARILTALAGRPDVPVEALAGLAGRGRRSGIGLHGFARGGLVVDGGRAGDAGVPPCLARLDLPGDWSILVAVPRLAPGLHGPAEARAFARLPPVPEAVTDRLCRLVLLGLLPAAAEGDLGAFGVAIEEIQALVGRGFSPVQGGIYADPHLAAIAARMHAEGLVGVGQSSWGPALYGFARGLTIDRREVIDRALRDHPSLRAGSTTWTAANRTGATLGLE